MTSNDVKTAILIDFLQMLERSFHLSTNPISIITVKESFPSFDSLIPNVFKEESVLIEIQEKVHPDVILGSLVEVLPGKKFIFLKIDTVIHPKVLNQLNLLSREGFLDTQIANVSYPIEEKFPRQSFLILLGKRKILENQHGNLFNLGAHFLDLT